jgi:site-specific DNA-methyltransferase (adenine-specific)
MQGDCLQLMTRLADHSADLILCDLPYGVTRCSWDKLIPAGPLFMQYGRILKENGALVLFAQQPFANALAAQHCGQLRFRYEWIWDKGASTGFQNAHRMPMRRHENILVFYRHLPCYNPQGVRKLAGGRIRRGQKTSTVYGAISQSTQRMTGFPTSILHFRRERAALPCQKPIELLEYLIRTYTNPEQVVLDNAMDTGSTGVAAVRTGRSFIGMELDCERFDLAQRRITEASVV